MHVLVAFFVVACYALKIKAEKPGNVISERLSGPHLAAASNTSAIRLEGVPGSFDKRQPDETNVEDNVEEERVSISWMEKVYDIVGNLAMKLKLNPRLVFILSRADVASDKNARFVQWLQYVIKYRAWKGGASHFSDSAIYNLVKTKKTDAELLRIFQSIQRTTKVPTAKQLAAQVSMHVVKSLEKSDWLVAQPPPRKVFGILNLGGENDGDNVLFAYWLNYINSYNGLGGNVKFTGQNLYDVLSVTRSDTNVATMSESLRYVPEFKKLAEDLQVAMVSNPASRKAMYNAWLEFAASPQRVFTTLRLEDNSKNRNDDLLTAWFYYIHLYWSGAEGKARQSEFSDTDCINLLRKAYSKNDLQAMFSSLRQDPRMNSFADGMLTHLGIDKQSEEWLAAKVSPTKAFSLLNLGSEDDPDNIKLYQLLTYVNEYEAIGDATKGKLVQFTDEDLYHLLQERKTPLDPMKLVQSLRQDPDMKILAERLLVYMVTNPDTKLQVYEAWLKSSTTPQQALEMLRTRHGRFKHLYGEWLGYVNFYWKGLDGEARHMKFGYDDCVGLLRIKLGSDDALEELLDSIRRKPYMKDIADDMLVYLKITQQTERWLDMKLSPSEAYRLLSAESGNDPDNVQLRQWLSFVDAYRGVDKMSATDEELYQMLKQLKASNRDLVNLVEWLQKFPYMKTIAKSMMRFMSLDDNGA